MQKFSQMDNIKTALRAEGFYSNIWFVAGWFAASATTLVFSAVFTFYISNPKLLKPSVQNFKLYAALPGSTSAVSDEIGSADGRAKIIEDFFKDYNSPLATFSDTFIQVSDKYNLDYRLLPAISMQESNGGKKVINDSYNPFGYGIYGGMVVKFESWDKAIERVGRALREDYLNKGLKTPFQIMAKYTPPSLAKDGAWAKGVSTFMEELL